MTQSAKGICLCHMDNFVDKKIAYQGAAGSYSHQCITKNFTQAQALGHTTFEEVIHAVQNNSADYALLPVENSIAGRVMDMHNLLAGSGLHIIAEYYHNIEHCLLVKSGATLNDIESAYSHPMALAQCKNFLQNQKIDAVSFTDTAHAAEFISRQDSLSIAAICAENNKDIYTGLEVIKKDIQDTENNTTRFFLLGREPENLNDGGVYSITAIFFTTKNIPAALYKSLAGFAHNDVNVTKLESFMPLLGNGSARFYIEIDGAPTDTRVKKALQELELTTSKREILGTFAKTVHL